MNQLEQLFDESRDLHRVIEKVITFGVAQEERLKKEIAEYIVTPHMEEEFEDLFTKMKLAMEHGGPNEVGVWLSGFYGSGKSSFAKYLGLALDDRTKLDGEPFLKRLQDRFSKAQTRQLLSTLSKTFPVAVVFLDLASDMLAGNTMEEISTVLFYKVLEYAGYSRNLKVAALERRLEKDGRLDEFKAIVRSDLGVDWELVQNDLLVVDSLIPEIAHRMYPNLFKTATAFTSTASEVVQFETDRVHEMLDIVRRRSGKQYIIFVLDEVGQYVASSPNLILNLDGLAKNLKTIGDGKVWIVATAQQTLTEDDPRAALNSPELFKLNDRFPIKIDLPASDIKKICYERLLKKSPAGESELKSLFDLKGQELRQNTKLENAKYYSADFDSDTFVNLYPFLPSHFDILLQLLGALAKSTGGIGLRSAIKVIQDILIEGAENQPAACKQPVGWLATLVTMFDALEKDIERASKNIHAAYGKIGIHYPGSQLHRQIGKTVTILQILGNIPATRKNVAALMHSSVTASSRLADIETAIDEMITDPKVPFDERDGSLCFLSERLSEIQVERGLIPPRPVDIRRIFNTALTNVFDPLPTAKLQATLQVSAGIKSRSHGTETSLAGDRNTIQKIIEFVKPEAFETRLDDVVIESQGKASRNNIFLLGKFVDDIDKELLEIYRCEEIAKRFKNDADEDVREYCSSQIDRSHILTESLQHTLERHLVEGVLVFRADKTAVESLGSNVLEACNKLLSASVVDRVYEKYSQAPVRVDTALAEEFMKKENLNAITAKIDPLGLIKKVGGSFQIDTSHVALTSIRDHLDSQGSLDGKQLTQRFTNDPFAWSPDTLRYLVAALFRAGELKLKISGNEVTALGQVAIEGLRNNNSFKKVIVSQRETRPKPESLARAAIRLTELTGDQVIPLEDDICKAASRYFASIQNEYASLAQKLENLHLPGSDELQSVCSVMADLLANDASDAPAELGSEDSILYHGIARAAKIQSAFEQGIGVTIAKLRKTFDELAALPDAGIPGQLRNETIEEVTRLKARLASDSFYEHAPDYSSGLTSLNEAIAKAAKLLEGQQKKSILNVKKTLQNLPQWKELNHDEQAETLGRLDSKQIVAESSLFGLKQLINNDYSLTYETNATRDSVAALGDKRLADRLLVAKKRNGSLATTIKIRRTLRSISDIDSVQSQIDDARQQAESHPEFEITLEWNDN